LIYVTAFCITFISVFLKGFQYKNVLHNNWISMAATSYMMNVFEVLAVGNYAMIFIKGDWWYSFISGTSAAIAIVAASWLHTKIYEKNRGKETQDAY